MILTKKYLKKYQENMRVCIPEKLAQELLNKLGDYAIDDEGCVRDYTEQDICEQIRKKLQKNRVM